MTPVCAALLPHADDSGPLGLTRPLAAQQQHTRRAFRCDAAPSWGPHDYVPNWHVLRRRGRWIADGPGEEFDEMK